MTTHALAGDRLIAMALLKPGWEKNYYARPAIEPVVCVGRILTYEHLANGEFNFLLQGVWRLRRASRPPRRFGRRWNRCRRSRPSTWTSKSSGRE